MPYSVDRILLGSKVSHPTRKYPPHVLEILDKFIALVNKEIPENPYKELSSGVDIIYDSSFPLGGSIGKHSDDEDKWGLVVVYSLGQSRFFRVQNKETSQMINVKLTHNSLVVMYGKRFQELYTHQVDKLKEKDKVGTRLSLNARYK